MDFKQIIARMAEQRSRWVELEPGKHVRVLRPLESDFPAYIERRDGQAYWSCSFAQVKSAVDAWKGFTEADLIDGGADDEVPFAPELWAVVVGDRVAYVAPVRSAVVDLISEHRHSLDAIEKN